MQGCSCCMAPGLTIMTKCNCDKVSGCMSSQRGSNSCEQGRSRGGTVIGQNNEAVPPLQGLLVARVEVQAVVGFAHEAAHHSLAEAAPHIPAPSLMLMPKVPLQVRLTVMLQVMRNPCKAATRGYYWF